MIFLGFTRRVTAMVWACALCAVSVRVAAESPPEPTPASYSVNTLVAMARSDNPALIVERTRIAAAQAGVLTARALPNPELAWLAGRQSNFGVHGRTGAVEITQPIDRPGLRRARIDSAEAGVGLVRQEVNAFERELIAEVKLKALEVLRLEAAARLASQALSIVEQVRERVQVRVGTGEAPRFELIRADTERLNAQRAQRAAILRVEMARTELRRLVGPALPAAFRIEGSIEDAVAAPAPLASLRTAMLEHYPELRAVRAAQAAAEARLALEKSQRLPTVAVKVIRDQVPDLVDQRVGVVMTVPLLDRRQGPIAEASVELERSQRALTERSLALERALQSAWQRYELARAEVAGFESGLLQEAEAALRVAEAAYRYGERGILDYLDAQRTVRTVRDELNHARYELRAALIDLERLSAVSE